MKTYLDMNVYEAAKQRIEWTFDTFERIYVSFSAGKDSTCMLHMVMDEAIKRDRKIGVLLIDLEGQYKKTIDHAEKCTKIIPNGIGAVCHFICAMPYQFMNRSGSVGTQKRKKTGFAPCRKIAFQTRTIFRFFKTVWSLRNSCRCSENGIRKGKVALVA